MSEVTFAGLMLWICTYGPEKIAAEFDGQAEDFITWLTDHFWAHHGGGDDKGLSRSA